MRDMLHGPLPRQSYAQLGGKSDSAVAFERGRFGHMALKSASACRFGRPLDSSGQCLKSASACGFDR